MYVSVNAKQVRFSFPSRFSTSTSIFSIVHGDVWGIYWVLNHDNKRYFVTSVDDLSNYTIILLMHTKSYTFIVLKKFLDMVQTQFETNVRCLRTHNDTEFFNSHVHELLINNGILTKYC